MEKNMGNRTEDNYNKCR